MATLSLKNAKHPAPKWFRKMKAFILTIALGLNTMIANYPVKNEQLKMRIQLWCTIGIVYLLEGAEKLLKDDEDDEAKTEGQ